MPCVGDGINERRDHSAALGIVVSLLCEGIGARRGGHDPASLDVQQTVLNNQ